MAKSYLIDIGNSSEGPIGACARVLADSPEEALDIFQRMMPDETSVETLDDFSSSPRKILYFNVYFNPGAITLQDVGEEEED